MRRPQAGFTILELIMVIVILGIIGATSITSMGGITPKYRLRSAARHVGSLINEIRATAVNYQDSFTIRYNFENRSTQVFLPPKKEEDPNLPVEERESLSRRILPPGVIFERVVFPDGTEATAGYVDIELDPYGHEGSHIVYLRNDDDAVLTVKYNALLGITDYGSAAVQFESYVE